MLTDKDETLDQKRQRLDAHLNGIVQTVEAVREAVIHELVESKHVDLIDDAALSLQSLMLSVRELVDVRFPYGGQDVGLAYVLNSREVTAAINQGVVVMHGRREDGTFDVVEPGDIIDGGFVRIGSHGDIFFEAQGRGVASYRLDRHCWEKIV